MSWGSIYMAADVPERIKSRSGWNIVHWVLGANSLDTTSHGLYV